MLQKQRALEDIDKDFKAFADLLLRQVKELERIIKGGINNFSKGEIKKVEGTESLIDDYELKLSEQIINAIVLYNPVASELRKLMALYRIVINMERIGDLIKATIYAFEKMEQGKLYNDLSDILTDMVLSSGTMVEKSLLSFINEDKDAAIWTIQNDEMVDEMTKKLMKKSIKKSKMQDEVKEVAMNIINFRSVITRIERIADHAGHIAEAAIFASEGKDVRHTEV